METTFKIWKRNRELYQNYFDQYSVNQLNEIPIGFNNNLIWNIAHVLVVQQKLMYRTSTKDVKIPLHYFNIYNTGEIPKKNLSE